MGARLGKLKSAVTDLEDVLTELKYRNMQIDEHEVTYVQELKRTVAKWWKSLNEKWELHENDKKNFKDENEWLKCKKT